MMSRREWDELDDNGKAIYAHMVECDRFRSKVGRMPRPDEVPPPRMGEPYQGDMPVISTGPVKAKSRYRPKKRNTTPGVCLESYKRRGKLFRYWTATFSYGIFRRRQRFQNRYDACVARNEFVRECFGDTRPDLMIDLTKIEELKAS